VTSSCCAVDAAYEAVQALTGSFLGDHQINLQLEENIPQVTLSLITKMADRNAIGMGWFRGPIY
jgi:hypothetical protein